MENLDRSTLELLTKYLENGGKLLSVNLKVNRIDGEKSDEVKKLAEKYPEQWINVQKLEDTVALNLLGSDQFNMIEDNPNGMLYHQRRILDDGELLFVANISKTKSAEANIYTKGKYVVKMDLITGKQYIYPAKSSNGSISFHLELNPVESVLFAITNKRPEGLEKFRFNKAEKPVASLGKVQVNRESDNILVVNYIDLKNSKTDKKEVYFMDGLIGLFEENGVELGNPWQHKIQYKKNYLKLDSMFTDDSGFNASYHFEINENLGAEAMRSVRVVVERPELWEVSINGHTATKLKDTYWIDKDFPVFTVGEYLRKGDNIITLKAPRMHILAEVMPVYILGDFLVRPGKKGFELTAGELNEMGSWKEKGMPFYSQKVSYRQDFDVKKSSGSFFKIKLNNWKGSVSEVWVNGEKAGLVAWQPGELDVTKWLKDGENQVEVKVCGSLKNTFGFFYSDNNNWIFGPHSWNSAPEKIPPASDYFLLDYGLFEPFNLIEYESLEL